MKLFWTKLVLFLFFHCFKAAISEPGKFFNWLNLFFSTFFELLTPQRPGFRSPPKFRFITPKLLQLFLCNFSKVKIIYLTFVGAKKFFKIHLTKYAQL